MEGLLESLKNLMCVEAGEVSVAGVTMRPATGAARTRFSDAEPENAVGPNAEAHAKAKGSREVYVETLAGILHFAAAFQSPVIPNRLSAALHGAGNALQPSGREMGWSRRLHGKDTLILAGKCGRGLA
jgi:hypothetical protein